MRKLFSLYNIKSNKLFCLMIICIPVWIMFLLISVYTGQENQFIGSIISKIEFGLHFITFFVIYKILKDVKPFLDKDNYNILIYFSIINLWLFVVDFLFYIAAYANNSLLQNLTFLYFALYYLPCIIFATTTILFLSKILIQKVLLANGFVKRFAILLLVSCITFILFLSSVHYAYQVFSLENILQIILLFVEFILFDISVIGLIYANNISVTLFLSGVIMLVTGDYFLTYTSISQTISLMLFGEFFWGLGILLLMFSVISIKENKQYRFNQWFKSDNAIKSRLGFGVFFTSIIGFLVVFIVSNMLGFIGKQIFIVFPLCIMLYSIITVILSVFIARSFELPFKQIENNVNILTHNTLGKHIDHNFSIEEFIFLQNSLTTSFKFKESQDLIRKQFGDLSAEVVHDIGSLLNTMDVLVLNLKTKNSTQNDITLLEASMQSLKNITKNLLTRYRTATNSKLNKLNIINDDSNTPRYFILSSLIAKVLENKRIELSNTNCKIILDISTISKFAWVCLSPLGIDRVISNLLNNSYESMGKSSSTIVVKLDIINRGFIMTIEDNGCGIPDNKIQNILLFGESSKHSGRGLGLSFAQKYMKSIDGNLTIESTVNKGTKVSLCIPQPSSPLWFYKQINYTDSSIFVILDDDPSVMKLWQHILTKINVRGNYFATVDEFKTWYLLSNNPESIILFIDYYLHDVSTGIDIIEEFKMVNAYLFTSHAEESWLQDIVTNKSLRLCPKSMIEQIRLAYTANL